METVEEKKIPNLRKELGISHWRFYLHYEKAPIVVVVVGPLFKSDSNLMLIRMAIL
jgi:hypothetical protein